MPNLLPSPEEICQGGVFAIRNTIDHVKWYLRTNPDRALETEIAPGRGKEALRVDITAEDQFLFNLIKEYEKGFLSDIKVYGEESINEQTDFSGEDGVVALVDMVDGTDLVERNLSNWCSAAIFFRPKNDEGNRILASCVGMPSDRIYYVHADSKGVRYKPKTGPSIPVGGKSDITRLAEASVCFYGQKAARLKEVAERGFLNYMLTQQGPLANKGGKEKQRKKNRIYTLAGIPMMIKLIDHQVKCAANIDVVFECNGQHPHDVVAGAYLAKRAGAVIKSIDTGKELSYIDLEESLLRPAHPDSQLRYVIASTEELCDEILPLLQPIVAEGTSN